MVREEKEATLSLSFSFHFSFGEEEEEEELRVGVPLEHEEEKQEDRTSCSWDSLAERCRCDRAAPSRPEDSSRLECGGCSLEWERR